MDLFSKQELFIIFIVVGTTIALVKDVNNKNDNDYKNEIKTQNALSKILLEVLSGLTISVLGASEILAGVVSTLSRQYGIIFMIPIILFVAALLSFVLSLGINEGTTKPPQTETMSGYLARKKVLYNKIGIISYFSGVTLLLILLFLSH